jgi:hypothetical protein
MGSNSFRLEIGQLVDDRYRRIDYLKETVRLGGGLDASGFLGEEAAARGLDCLARFASRLDGFAPSQVRAVATQTLREAKNRNAFLARPNRPSACRSRSSPVARRRASSTPASPGCSLRTCRGWSSTLAAARPR